jgi:hypothetical protein
MSEKSTHLAKRALQTTVFTVGGGVALAFAMAGSASADTVTGQGAGVVNTGVGIANSGGNVAVGNSSENNGGCAQGSLGGIANNSCDASNTSDGTANITTGNATAVGNQSETNISQAASGGDGGGLAVTGQGAGVVNAGVGVANSGLNGAVGNDSENNGGCLQGAVGFVANNSCDASNSSDGTASITTGDATGIGNRSATSIHQGATADPNGLGVVVQVAPVLNAGLGIANSGLNFETGNTSLNNAILAQVSFGLLANNVANAGNWSDGFAMIVTGNATGIGNDSSTWIDQNA